jgi:hypothetical protein
MPLLTWQLWLARPHVQDSPLPWQKASPDHSSGRVANAFAQVLVVIGSPAPAPKPRGKSPAGLQGDRVPVAFVSQPSKSDLPNPKQVPKSLLNL